MRLQPTITFEQYKETYRVVAVAKPNLPGKRSWQDIIMFGVGGIVVAVAAQHEATRIPAFSVCAALLVCWALYVPLSKRSRDERLKRIYREEQASLNGQVLTVDESGISCSRSNGEATSHYSWQAFTSYIEMPDALIFLPSPNSFVRVPKENLTRSDDQLIRQWISGIPLVTAK